jgi:hypothetical protein
MSVFRHLGFRRVSHCLSLVALDQQRLLFVVSPAEHCEEDVNRVLPPFRKNDKNAVDVSVVWQMRAGRAVTWTGASELK